MQDKQHSRLALLKRSPRPLPLIPLPTRNPLIIAPNDLTHIRKLNNFLTLRVRLKKLLPRRPYQSRSIIVLIQILAAERDLMLDADRILDSVSLFTRGRLPASTRRVRASRLLRVLFGLTPKAFQAVRQAAMWGRSLTGVLLRRLRAEDFASRRRNSRRLS